MGFYERLTCIVIEVRTVENVNKQEIIQRAIQNLISEFRKMPNKFLSEEDLRYV
jgi:DNA-directed RNA polymerase subunit L